MLAPWGRVGRSGEGERLFTLAGKEHCQARGEEGSAETSRERQHTEGCGVVRGGEAPNAVGEGWEDWERGRGSFALAGKEHCQGGEVRRGECGGKARCRRRRRNRMSCQLEGEESVGRGWETHISRCTTLCMPSSNFPGNGRPCV